MRTMLQIELIKFVRKINNKYSLIISGDCCLIDNSLINRVYKSLKKNSKFDFIKCKNF